MTYIEHKLEEKLDDLIGANEAFGLSEEDKVLFLKLRALQEDYKHQVLDLKETEKQFNSLLAKLY
jgi:hypothetical protein